MRKFERKEGDYMDALTNEDYYKKYQFTESQRHAWDILCSGKNVFLTGNAGSGKSYLIDCFIQRCNDIGLNTIVTAPTGIASQNIKNGTTIHRAFKIKVPINFDEAPKVGKEILVSDVIIIDEISMCRCDVFDYIAQCLQKVTKTSHRHQLIVIGDLYQLPPVLTKDEIPYLIQRYPNILKDKGYPFNAYSWEDFHFTNVMLKEPKRQSDIVFLEKLDQARVGDVSCIDYFNKRLIRHGEDVPENAIMLVGTNKACDTINNNKLKGLGDVETHTYTMKTEGVVNNGDKVISNKITLKIGARVMAVKNSEDIGEYQNGSLGEVVGFTKERKLPIVLFDNGVRVVIDESRWDVLKPKSEVIDEKMGIVKVVMEAVGSYTQIPLKLAYAITMHKSQGQTYDNVIIDPVTWDNGQLYVALSRVKSYHGLFLTRRIVEDYLHASSAVRSYYENFNQKYINDNYEWIKINCPSHLVQEVQSFIEEKIKKIADDS